MRRKIRIGLLFAHLIVLGLAHAAPAETDYLALSASDEKPGDVWGFAELKGVPFDTEVVSSAVDDGVLVEGVYFTSEIANGAPVRVFGFLARPEHPDGRVPGILALHGGGGTADRAGAVRSARDLSMCVLSIDWSGQPERGEHVSTAGGLPPELFGDPRHVTDDLSDFSARHTMRALVRSISFLESLAYMDPARLGVWGGSWGGFLSLLAAGLDPRVSFAVSGFGAGGFRGTHEFCARPVLRMGEAQQEFWFNTVDPINYLDQIRGPVALMTATNELHFWLNTAMATQAKLPPGSRIMIVPNAVHTAGAGVVWPHVDWARMCFGNAPDWPEIVDFSFDGVEARWQVRGGVPVKTSRLYYSPGADHWPSRIWLPVEAKLAEGTYRASLPPWAAGGEADAYPLVTDEAARSVSVSPVHADGATLQEVSRRRPDLGLVDDFSRGVEGWRLLFGNAGKASLEWSKGDRPAMVIREKRGEDSEIEVETNLIYLAAAALNGDARLCFGIDTEGRALRLRAQLMEDPGEETERTFTARVDLNADAGWREVEIPLADFEGQGETLVWSSVRKLSLAWPTPPNGAVALTGVRVEAAK